MRPLCYKIGKNCDSIYSESCGTSELWKTTIVLVSWREIKTTPFASTIGLIISLLQSADQTKLLSHKVYYIFGAFLNFRICWQFYRPGKMHYLCVILALVCSNVGKYSEPTLKFGLLGLCWCLLVRRDVACFWLIWGFSMLLSKARFGSQLLCSALTQGLILCRMYSSQGVYYFGLLL